MFYEWCCNFDECIYGRPGSHSSGLVKQLAWSHFSSKSLLSTLTFYRTLWEDFTCLDISQCKLNKTILHVAAKYLLSDVSAYLGQFVSLGAKASFISSLFSLIKWPVFLMIQIAYIKFLIIRLSYGVKSIYRWHSCRLKSHLKKNIVASFIRSNHYF